MILVELANRFAYHRPKNDLVVQRHQVIREAAQAFAETVNSNCPEGREQSLAVTHIEDAMMWANAAIARNQ